MSAPTATDTAALLQDLADEERDLDGIVATLDDEHWARPTPAPGWDIHDQIIHLAFVEELARTAATDATAFAEIAAEAAKGPLQFEASQIERGRRQSGTEVLAWWRRERDLALAALAGHVGGGRLPWFGPPMSLRSFVTARLMETWAHGCDVADALGVERVPTHRLQHIAHLGYSTRGWSYVVRGMEPNATPVRVELDAPSGERWTFGPQDALERVAGPAVDFCLVVTQRRSLEETALAVQGPAATEWMRLAQAFAGPPTQRSTPHDRESTK